MGFQKMFISIRNRGMPKVWSSTNGVR